ncbi:activating signal cointegrator 1 [Onthophagus taurus]|uniref:activating signal cointegrator 1 n=1 Tax=Onthophagus taurus TaxID=166361 RepID=UPI0039BE8A26
MTEFIRDCLIPILGNDISDDILEYITTIKQLDDYEEFMENIVDLNNAEHVTVYEALKQHQFGIPHKKLTNKKAPKQSLKNDNKAINSPQLSTSQLSSSSNTPSSGGKGKKRYTNFYTHDHKPGLLKGRHPCDCQATKHDLINNCTKCGRIVCAQEGSGPCFFCDNMVCTRYEMEVLNKNTKESDKLYNHLVEQKKSKEWKKALETRNRLLKTDQMGDSIKNKIFDDQNDYFDLNSKWLSEDDKSNLKKKHASMHSSIHKNRRDMKLALDFASRTVTLDNDEHLKNKKKLMVGVNKLLDSTERRFPKNLFSGEKGELITEIFRLMDAQSLNDSSESEKKTEKNEQNVTKRVYRIANNDFLESVDQGLCLSMHQPWASLLVSGIKIHEGRTWKTNHRGRLWIAAASKEPEDDEILACEQMYRDLYNDPSLEFPKKYPTGCLLGCVFVDDCLEQGEYQEKFPNGESGSPYVFICSNPVILPVFYPMQGQHKIFSLPKELHKTAKAALMSSKWV